jgi:hypothetical protein
LDRVHLLWKILPQLCALIASVRPVLHQNSCSNETFHNMGLGSNVVARVRRNFVARTCALIAPFRPILHRYSCSNKTVRNTRKHELGSIGVDWVRLLRKIPMRLHCTNLCISCTSSAHLACIKTRVWVQWDGLGAFVVKKCRHNFVARTCALIAPIRPILHQSSCGNGMVRKAQKHKFGV